MILLLFFLTRLSTVEAKGPGSQRHKSSLTEGSFCEARALVAAAESERCALVLKAEVCAAGKKKPKTSAPLGRTSVPKEEREKPAPRREPDAEKRDKDNRELSV